MTKQLAVILIVLGLLAVGAGLVYYNNFSAALGN